MKTFHIVAISLYFVCGVFFTPHHTQANSKESVIRNRDGIGNAIEPLKTTVSTKYRTSQPVNIHFQGDPNGEVIQKAKEGSMNWTTQRIEARGYAEKGQSFFQQNIMAEVLARANLLKVLDGLYIKSETTVRDGRLEKDIITEHLEGFLKHSHVSNAGINKLGLLEVTAYVEIDKDTRSILLSAPRFKRTPDREAEEGSPPAYTSQAFTGIIFDARGLKIKPAMMPNILIPQKKKTSLTPDLASKAITCAYVGTLKKAKSLVSRIGEMPIVIKPNRISQNAVDLILSRRDAEKVLRFKEASEVFSKGKIVIVADTFADISR